GSGPPLSFPPSSRELAGIIPRSSHERARVDVLRELLGRERSRDLVGLRTVRVGPRAQALEIEAVQPRRVLAEDRACLVLGLVVEAVADRLARVRERSLVVRIVAAPEDVLDPDLVAAGELARRRRARAVVTVALRVEARRLGRHRALRELELADGASLH